MVAINDDVANQINKLEERIQIMKNLKDENFCIFDECAASKEYWEIHDKEHESAVLELAKLRRVHEQQFTAIRNEWNHTTKVKYLFYTQVTYEKILTVFKKIR
jgi:hypothetical protein